jgi:hypothetical protein
VESWRRNEAIEISKTTTDWLPEEVTATAEEQRKGRERRRIFSIPLTTAWGLSALFITGLMHFGTSHTAAGRRTEFSLDLRESKLQPVASMLQLRSSDLDLQRSFMGPSFVALHPAENTRLGSSSAVTAV